MEKEYTFDEFNISEDTKKALLNMGFEATTLVQSLSLSDALEGKDMLVKSQTGTGKTAVYAITFTENADVLQKSPQCLVLTPTRELAVQVSEEMKNIGRFKRLKVLPIYGGQELEGQKKNLRQRVHAVVGTPGRIFDHISRGNLDLRSVKLLVIDEVDEMFDMGFIEDIKKIIRNVSSKRQTMMFSATVSEDIETLAVRNMKNPIKIEATPDTVMPDFIEQYFYYTTEENRFIDLCKLLSKEAESITSTIIFCNTRKAVMDLAKLAKAKGMAVNTLHGEMTQDERTLSINKFKMKKSRIMIATDVAARGLDIENVSHVINYEIPKNCESYIHRTGRTGRAGRKGTAISFVTDEDKKFFNLIVETISKEITEGRELPKDYELTTFKKKNISEDEEETKPQKNSDLQGEITRLHISGGRKDKISAGDIVGAIAKNTDVSGDYIGVIDIYDNFSFVEIMGGKGMEVLSKMSKCNIKKKRVKVTEANNDKK